jgi:hypothetical protein
MEIVCPSCGKANQSTPCGRCGCELSPLFAIYRAADIELSVAGKCLRSGNVNEARERASHSWELRHTSKAARLAFLACIALDDFAWGRVWHRRAVTPRRQNSALTMNTVSQ